jgi:hypothetical protein
MQGRQVCLDDYRGDCSLVLVFPGQQEEPFLESFAHRTREYGAQGAKVLAVVKGPSSAPQSRMPFEVVVDNSGTTRKKYASLMDPSLAAQDDSIVFVLDQYNAPYAALVGASLPQAEGSIPDTGSSGLSEQEVHYSIQRWLEYIGVQCPE